MIKGLISASDASHSTNARYNACMKVRACADLSEAVLNATTPDVFPKVGPGAWDAFKRVSDKAKLTRWNGDCYLFVTMVMGFCDVIVDVSDRVLVWLGRWKNLPVKPEP